MKFIKTMCGKRAKVDDQDYEKHKDYDWYMYRGYVIRRKGTRVFYLHRLITETSWDEMKFVLFKDHDKLNCTRDNLTITNRSNQAHHRKPQNIKGKTSQYKGVGYNKVYKRWVARIQKDGKRISLGGYHSEIEAARAYNNAATEMYGDAAFLNEL